MLRFGIVWQICISSQLHDAVNEVPCRKMVHSCTSTGMLEPVEPVLLARACMPVHSAGRNAVAELKKHAADGNSIESIPCWTVKFKTVGYLLLIHPPYAERPSCRHCTAIQGGCSEQCALKAICSDVIMSEMRDSADDRLAHVISFLG